MHPYRVSARSSKEQVGLMPILSKMGTVTRARREEPQMFQERAVVELSESRRKELFHLLVVAQDYAMSVAEARQMVAELHGLVGAQVVRIEQEGLESNWPPL